jgi:hypothetical protein
MTVHAIRWYTVKRLQESFDCQPTLLYTAYPNFANFEENMKQVTSLIDIVILEVRRSRIDLPCRIRLGRRSAGRIPI